MKALDLVNDLKISAKYKSEKQYANLKKIGEIAGNFHEKNGTYTEGVKSQIDLLKEGKIQVLIEVAHQPNFLPYSGVWKKAVFADFIAKKLNENNTPSVAVFGLVDEDQSSKQYLYQNRIPFYSKNGYKNIGFSVKNKHLLWNKQPLPGKEKIIEHFDEIFSLYASSGLDLNNPDSSMFKEILYDSYINSQTFSEANSKFLTKFCNNVWNLNILFFQYSEIQNEGILEDEFEKVLAKRNEYIKIYNDVINTNKLKISNVPENHIPFWYHCECSGKIRLSIPKGQQNSEITICCPVCNKNHDINIFQGLNKIIKSMSPDAVARDVIFTMGLGTDVYLLGHGGSSVYSKISDKLLDLFHEKKARLISWKSKDVYISSLLVKNASIFLKISKRTNEDPTKDEEIVNRNILNLTQRIVSIKEGLKKTTKDSEDFLILSNEIKSLNEDRNRYMKEKQHIESYFIKKNNLYNALICTSSILDEILSIGQENIIKTWLNDLSIEDYDNQHLITFSVTGIKYHDLLNATRNN